MYKPTKSEINNAINHIRSIHGDLGGRLEKASQILTVGIDEIGKGWVVDSQQGGKSYKVSTFPRSCDCTDFQVGGAFIKGFKYCKHLIAVHAYVRILRSHLQERIAGAAGNAIKQAKSHPNTYLVRVGQTETLTTVERNGLTIKTKYSSEGVTFATDADAIAFAHWLAKAQRLPDAVSVVSVSSKAFSAQYGEGEFQKLKVEKKDSEWSRSEWEHWWGTGETPSMATSKYYSFT